MSMMSMSSMMDVNYFGSWFKVSISFWNKFEIYKGDKPLEFVISGNLKRRHLTADQRAVISQEVMPMLEEEARKRQNLGVKLPIGDKGRSSEKAGKMFDVSEKYVREVKKLKELQYLKQ